MKLPYERLKETINFLKYFDDAWHSESLPNPPKDSIRSRLNNIKSLSNNQEVSKDLFNFEEAGVIYTSDIITYLFTSRLAISLEDKIEEPDRLDEIYKFWLDCINYLLATNIFPPNDNIDQKDLGAGKYDNIHSKLRKEITREIFLEELNNGSSEKVYDLFGYIIENGRIYNSRSKSLKKNQLKKIGKELGLKEEDMKLLKEDLIELMKDVDYEKISSWIESLPADSEIWEGLSKNFMPLRTPGFLLKNVGLARELFVFLKLINTDLGYIIPLLLNQRLYSRLDKPYKDYNPPIDKYVLYPPDFLIAREGKIIGVELGRGKPELISTFASVTGFPTVYINLQVVNEKFDVERDFGFKCNLCFLSFSLCDEFISRFPNDLEGLKRKTCSDICGEEKARDCKDAVVNTEIPIEGTSNTKETQVHFVCLKKIHPDLADEIDPSELFPLSPHITGLEKIRLGLSY